MKTLFAGLTTAVFLAMDAFEVYHDLIRDELWPGYGAGGNYVVYVLTPLWLVGAASVWLRRDLAWLGIIVGVLASLAHGLGITIGGHAAGPVFLAAAPVLVVLAWYARRPDPVEALAGRGRDEAERARPRDRAGAR